MPPMIVAAMAVRARVSVEPLLDEAAVVRETSIMPAIAAHPPLRLSAITWFNRTRIPESLAASRLPPIAKSVRPYPVEWRITPVTTATARNTQVADLRPRSERRCRGSRSGPNW